LHSIARLPLSIIATASLLTTLLCPGGATFAQGLKFMSGGHDASGPFGGPGQTRGGNLQLALEIGLTLEKNPSPALFYATSHPIAEEKRFAYLCLVTHPFTADDLSSHFQFRL